MAATDVLVRKTTPADAELLPAVERSAGQAFRSIPELAWIADDDAQTVKRHNELISRGVSWVATLSTAEDADKDKPVGFLNGELLDGHLHIWEMSVDKQHQGRGIGTRLVHMAVEHATQRRLEGLTLTTFLDVPWNDAFYRRVGFEVLAAKDTSPALTQILNDESRDGLPRDRRCAMRLALEL